MARDCMPGPRFRSTYHGATLSWRDAIHRQLRPVQEPYLSQETHDFLLCLTCVPVDVTEHYVGPFVSPTDRLINATTQLICRLLQPHGIFINVSKQVASDRTRHV